MVGLALSGGGARASFQVGALRYLYDEVGITPSVITGTSAGSILAAVLAQSADHAGQRASLARLEQLFREMTHSSDMFEELPWYTRLRQRGPELIEALERRHRRQGTLGRSFRRVADLRHGITVAAERVARAGNGAWPAKDDPAAGTVPPAEDARAADAAAATVPPTKLTPDGRAPASEEAASAPAEPTPDAEEPAARSVDTGPVVGADEPVSVSNRLLDSIDLVRAVGRAGADLGTIVGGARRERSMFRPGRVVDRLVEPDFFQESAVASSGVTLRIAVVALESGELRYVTEAGTLVDRENRPVEEGSRVEIVEAVRASCAIPTVFPPVRLGEENYVDGGVRESLPADIALGHLGVDTCYAVVAGPSGVQREESFDDRDMLSIVLRTTTAIMTDEVQRDEVVRAREAGAVVIEPEFDVHDTLTIEPGLVAIAMDYGWLRAAEAHRGATPEEQAVTRDIILLRRRIWRAEEDAFGGGEPAEADLLQRVTAITGLKFALRDLLRQVPAGRLPEGAEDWWRTWEHHTFDIPVAPGWAAPVST